MSEADPGTIAAAVFRNESGRILAGLIRLCGSFDRAEEAMQEAFATALTTWQESGLPQNPAAWITTVAHRKLIDAVRRESLHQRNEDALRYEADTLAAPPAIDESPMHFPDDRLRLIFTCCHPALHPEARIALTLRTLGGLTTPEIAKAFLVPEPTLAQRLVRAKRKIQEARIPYEVPPPNRLAERLGSVQAVIYLVFNEGYAAATGARLVRADLCAEAIRLGRLLRELMPREAGNLALLALMLLQHSRRDARFVNGALVTLEEQDRTLWDRAAISEGLVLVDEALRLAPAGPYALQAAIAALHAEAQSPARTDWRQIAALYERLEHLQPTPVVALNHAVAIAMSEGFEVGLARIDALGQLDHYYLFHAARADLLRRLGRHPEAADAYRRAIELTTNEIERSYLTRRLSQLL